MKTISLSEAKDRLSGLVEETETTHEMVTITKHGRPAAVLMAADDLESLHETLFWLSQPGSRADRLEAEAQDEDASTMSSDELREHLQLPPA